MADGAVPLAYMDVPRGWRRATMGDQAGSAVRNEAGPQFVGFAWSSPDEHFRMALGAAEDSAFPLDDRRLSIRTYDARRSLWRRIWIGYMRPDTRFTSQWSNWGPWTCI